MSLGRCQQMSAHEKFVGWEVGSPGCVSMGMSFEPSAHLDVSLPGVSRPMTPIWFIFRYIFIRTNHRKGDWDALRIPGLQQQSQMVVNLKLCQKVGTSFLSLILRDSHGHFSYFIALPLTFCEIFFHHHWLDDGNCDSRGQATYLSMIISKLIIE